MRTWTKSIRWNRLVKPGALTAFLAIIVAASAEGQDRDQRIADLERKLAEANGSITALQKTVASLSKDVQALRQPDNAGQNTNTLINSQAKESAGKGDDAAQEFASRIIAPDIGGNERDHMLEAKPEIFLQTRYSVAPFDGAGSAFNPNLRLSRIETRWAGKINEHLVAGVEIQFQESVEGSPEKLVNDAFLEYYLNDRTSVRAGQFIKPFGFSVQESSWQRESPERPIFSEYFFPGERDRGVMLFGDLSFLSSAAFKDLQYSVGAFNGNRFFNDSNRQVNYMARVRKIVSKDKLAVGASVQVGKQRLPPGCRATIMGSPQEFVSTGQIIEDSVRLRFWLHSAVDA